MQSIPKNIIGTSLSQIVKGNPAAAPPIHLWTKGGATHLNLGIIEYVEHVEEGRETPSAVVIIACDTIRGGNTGLLYWCETEEDRPHAQRILGEFRQSGDEIKSMAIGNI